MIISNESMDLNDPKEFDDPQVFDDPKGISIGSMNFDNPKSMVIPPSSLVLFAIENIEIFGQFGLCDYTHILVYIYGAKNAMVSQN